ncbi:protein kinase, putative [Theileria annulata]|uniref:non-specific serine/threonine protein kinase n=1 Tax=Theileria annulata TaxID=5874 RepID=Q4UDU5_THEAN|nr:protein kinase, putative [Theileria annulata]CAI74744.1 protein kinase, putative [Theileria annulata]|eukprot:XP_952476.1 protein kinase, putative [Theileria annulata]
MYKDTDHIIAQGAEAVCLFVVKKVQFLGKECVLKRRLPKLFRHTDLDQSLTRSRMVAECRSTYKLRKEGVYVPVIYLVDFLKRETIYEYVQGDTVNFSISNSTFNSYHLIGENIALMHNANIIHGDLTTKNMIMTNDGLLCIIDFGLSFFSTISEDKAVDLYVLERCLTPSEFEKVLNSYKSVVFESDEIIRKLEEVRLRGRKRDLTG